MPRDFVNEDLGSAAGAGPFAKLLPDGPVADDVLRHLLEGRALIAQREGWCQNGGYLNAKGERTSRENGDAIARCSWGALREISTAGEMLNDPAFLYLSRFCGGNVISFNDNHMHAEVLVAWDRAIAARRAELAS